MFFILFVIVGYTIGVQTQNVEKIRLSRNENYFLKDTSIILGFNSENELNFALEHQNLTLLTEYERIQMNQGIRIVRILNYEPFFVEGDYKIEIQLIDICIEDNQTLDCPIRIKNQIHNSNIEIMYDNYMKISYPEPGCSFVHNLKNQKIILKCSNSQQNNHFILINNNSQVLDTLYLENVNRMITIAESKLLGYQQGCQICEITIINIQNEKFEPFYQTEIIDVSKIYEGNTGTLIEIEQCSEFYIRIQYEKVFIYYRLKDKDLSFYDASNQAVDNNCPKSQIKPNFNEYNDSKSEQDDISQKIGKIKIEEAFDINGNLILLYNQKIIAINNQLLNQTLDEKFIQMVKLEKLPFLVGWNHKYELIFYRVNQYETFFSYMNTTYIAVVQKYFHYFDKNKIKLYQIEFYDVENPQIIFEKQNISVQVEMNNQNDNLSYSFNSQGLPIEILNSEQQISKLVDIKCDLVEDVETFKFLKEQNTLIAVIYQNLSGEICILSCNKKKRIKLPVTYSIGAEQFFVSLTVPNFAIKKKYGLVLFSISSSFEIILRQIIHDDYSFQIKQHGEQLNLYFSNCTHLTFSLKNMQIIQQQLPYHFYNCTNASFQKYDNIFIDDKNLYFTTSSLIFRYSFGKLLFIDKVQHFTLRYLLVIFYLSSENQICITLFKHSNYAFNIFYEIPTYDYIVQPQYKIFQNYIIVVGLKDNQESLLIYDGRNKVSNCLIAITLKDKGNYNFGFIDNSIIYYVLNGTVQFYQIDQFKISLTWDSNPDQMISTSVLNIDFTSKIPCQTVPLSLNLKKINNIQTIQYRQTKYITLNEYINLENIVGQVEKIDLIEQQQTQIQKSIVLFGSVICQQFSNFICYNESSLIYNIFETSKQVIQQNVNKILFIEMDEENRNYNIYFENIIPQLLKQPFLQENRDPSIFPLPSWINNIICVGIDTFFYFNDYQILAWSNKSQTQYTVHNYLLSQQQQFQIIHLQNNNFIEVQIMEDSQIKILKYYFDESGYFQVDFTIVQLNILSGSNKKIKILSSQLTKNTIEIELFSDSLGYFGYIHKIQLIWNPFSYHNHYLTNYVRYGQRMKFSDLLYCDNKFMILGLSEQNQIQEKLSIYDISYRDKYQMIDSIYSQIDNETIKIEKYNETHFVQILENNTVQLIMIDKYRIICENECLNQYQVILTNEVSSIQTLLIKKEKQQNTIISIIVIDLLFIIGFLIYRKNKYQLIRKQ